MMNINYASNMSKSSGRVTRLYAVSRGNVVTVRIRSLGMTLRALLAHAVDGCGEATGTEAVIDIDGCHAGCATVEHAEQRGQAVEACAIADGCGILRLES